MSKEFTDPAGNLNALYHGLYVQAFSHTVQEEFRNFFLDYYAEIMQILLLLRRKESEILSRAIRDSPFKCTEQLHMYRNSQVKSHKLTSEIHFDEKSWNKNLHFVDNNQDFSIYFPFPTYLVSFHHTISTYIYLIHPPLVLHA